MIFFRDVFFLSLLSIVLFHTPIFAIPDGSVWVESGEPNPGDQIDLYLNFKFDDPNLRPATWELVFSVDTLLQNQFIEAKLAEIEAKHLTLHSVSFVGSLLTVIIKDDFSDLFFGYNNGDAYASVSFSGVSLGSFQFDLLSANALDSSGTPIATVPPFAHDVVVANPSIDNPYDLGDWSCDVPHAVELVDKYFKGGVKWSLNSGNLPPGWDVSPLGAIGGIAPKNSAGVYVFSIRAEDDYGGGVISTFSITILNEAPYVEDLRFNDVDLDGTVSVGDKLEITYNEPISAGSNWAQAITPIVNGDDFGVGASIAQPEANIISICLGISPVLQNMGTGSGLKFNNGISKGIVDSKKLEQLSSIIVIEEVVEEWSMPYWSIGVSIKSITLTYPPFPNPGFIVEDLPPGLSYDGVTISGTPTEVGHGAVSVFLPAQSTGGANWHYVVNLEPEGELLLGELDFEPVVAPGSMFVATFIEFDPFGSIATAKIGTNSLLILPGATLDTVTYIIPDGNYSGDLVFEQDLKSYNYGPLIVAPSVNPTPGIPSLVSAFLFDNSANGLVHLQGVDFSSSATFKIAGVSAKIVVQGLSFAVVEISKAVDTEVDFLSVEINNGAVTAFFSDKLKGKCPNPKQVKKSGTLKQKFKQFCKLFDEALRRLGRPPSDKNKRAKLTLFLWAYHESGNFKDRVQNGPNPLSAAYGILQTQPDRARCTWNQLSAKAKKAIAKFVGKTVPELNKKFCKIIKAKAGDASDAGKWPAKDKCLCLYFKSDLFTLIFVREDFGRFGKHKWPEKGGWDKAKDSPEYEVFICEIARQWACLWHSKKDTEHEDLTPTQKAANIAYNTALIKLLKDKIRNHAGDLAGLIFSPPGD